MIVKVGIIMSRYLLKYKGTYRVKAKYDLSTNDYPRDAKGNIESDFDDLYIDCQQGTEIWHYGKKVLVALIPSVGRGKNIIRKLEDMGKQDIIIKHEVTDAEVLIYFKAKDIETMAKLCKVKTCGCNISPFSVKNLPRDKPKWNKYDPKDKDVYDKMIELLKVWIPNQGMQLGKAYRKFYSNFGESIGFDLVKESKEKNFKPLHILDMNGFVEDAVGWLEKNLR